MNHLPISIPVKSQHSKPKSINKTTRASRTTIKDPPISRPRSVFGNVRSNNILVKAATYKPLDKPSTGFPQKQTKNNNNITTKLPKTVVAKNKSSVEKPKPIFKKQSADSQDEVVVNNVVEPRTPLASPFMIKRNGAGTTPYYSAKDCSKCRFDRLETASYWLAEIRTAESAGKHFVSAAFFRLAFHCNAEPARNLEVELKRFLARHEHLSAQSEWKDVRLTFGILKNKSGVEGLNPGPGKDDASETSGEEQEKWSTFCRLTKLMGHSEN